MDQELLMRASFFQKHIEELEENLHLIEQQLEEMDKFSSSLDYLDKNDCKEILAPLGKGVFIKTSKVDKELFVEVGAGVVIKKSAQDTQDIVVSQVQKLNSARIELLAQIDIVYNHLKEIIEKIEKSQKAAQSN